ncbi:MAG: hypothetical protein ACP5HM_09940 [Anaerolineae bacterium]
MKTRRNRWLVLIVALVVALAITGTMASASAVERPQSRLSDEPLSLDDAALTMLPAWADPPAPDGPVLPSPPSSSELSSQPTPSRVAASDRERALLSPLAPAGVGDTLQVFTNTWSYHTLGLVYVPGRDVLRYVHESQSSSHNPTIYDVDYTAHTVVYSVALSTQNTGWPWQLDNRTGTGYNFLTGNYFLPDYNGDLIYADDNIVEVDVNGNVLNAWEMDDEISSNDSADGSEIDRIIDIAVVPGNPTRYFATAAYDGGVVYEIVLTRTGSLWTPNSWYTVMTYTGAISDTFTDNLGIDYDAQNEVLYHSGWHTTTILVTDLSMNPVTEFTSTFDCPGAGGYNSGVTFVEGSDPPEIWVTDFSSDQTTRCEAPGRTPPPPGWEKWIDGQPYDPDGEIEKQMAEIITVTDVITAVEPFTLTETWNPDRLTPVGLDVFPSAAQVITAVGSLRIIGPGGPPPVVTVTKWFRLEPCSWITTTLTETLEIEGAAPFASRPVTIVKQAPELWIDAAYEPEVYAGDITSFTLTYSNTGGFENQVWISSTFPITAPFVHADPFPDAVGPDGRWTRWNVGNLAQNQAGSIEVYVFISDTVPASNTVTIWDGIFNHVDVLQEETWADLHVTGTLATVSWEKYIAGQPWHPGISITRQTSDTFPVEDHIVPPSGNPDGFSLIEEWNPGELRLLTPLSETVGPITYSNYVTMPVPGVWILEVPAGVDHGPVHVFKEFHLEPSTWPDTVLWEELQIGTDPPRPRPVLVNKHQPELWLDGEGGGEVYGGDETQFVLRYGNNGGRESGAWITSTFPAEATFVDADPMPLPGEHGDHWAKWSIGTLPGGGTGTITITVEITRGLPPSTSVEMWGGILNHADELRDDAIVGYHVPPPTWEKQVNGQPWSPSLGVIVETSDTFTVAEVISTRSAMAMVEHWNPERLALITYTTEPEAGIILSNTDFLSWEFPGGAPGEITLTKWFRTEPCTWTYTVLWEELWVEGIEWDRLPVHVDKIPPVLHLEGEGGGEVYAGREVSFTLAYSNTGGYENEAWISSTFPISAPFASASLTPTHEAGDGTWAAWRLGGLETHAEGALDITVGLAKTLDESDVVEIWSGVYHNKDRLITDTVVTYQITGRHLYVYLPLVLRNPD